VAAANSSSGFIIAIKGKVLTMNGALATAALLFLLAPSVVCQSASPASDCSTLKYSRRKVSCLCGRVQVCSGDLCGRPSDYKLDDDIRVELRDKAGTTILDFKKVIVEARERQCATAVGINFSCNTTERTFCFKAKRDGDYQLAFILFKNGVPQPAVKFPTKYSHKQSKPCNSVYSVETTCPR